MARALTDQWVERTKDTLQIQPLGDVIPASGSSSLGPVAGRQQQRNEAVTPHTARRRTRDDAAAENSSQSYVACQGSTQTTASLQPQGKPRGSPRTQASWDKAVGWSPVGAARQVLSADRPEMLARMDEAVLMCRRAHSDRNYRFNSLGVFDASKNEVRARSMLRVHMHKELSTTSMRVPQAHKEVRADKQDDTLPVRLERMFVRVLKSIDDHPKQGLAMGRALSVWVGNGAASPHRRVTDATSVTGCGSHHGRVRGHNHTANVHHNHHSLQELHSPQSVRHACSSRDRETRSTYHGVDLHSPNWPTAAGIQHMYNRCQAQDSSWPSPHTHRQSSVAQQPRANATCAERRSTSGFFSPSPHTPKSASGWGQDAQRRHSPAWAAHLPPEIAAAQIAHLTTITKEAIARYHAAVVEAQSKALLAAGLPEDVQLLGPQGLADELNGQTGIPTPFNDHMDEDPAASAKASSCPVYNASNLPELISAALQHVGDVSEELKQLQASLPKKEHKPVRCGKPSIPMRHPVGQSPTPSPAGSTEATPAGQGTDAGQEDELWPSLLGHQLHTSVPWSHGNEEWEGDEYEDTPDECDAGMSEGNEKDVALQQTYSAEAQAAKSPRGSRAPINPSPITVQRLETFQQSLQVAALDVDSGVFVVTPLSPLPPSRTIAQCIQARLERVWDMLHVPLAARLDSVLAFTDRQRTGELESALQVWEQCAAAVEQREQLLSALSSMQLSISQNQVGRVSLAQLEAQCVLLHQLTLYVVQQADKLRASHGLELTYAGAPYPGSEVVHAQDMMRFMEWLRDEAPATVLIMPA